MIFKQSIQKVAQWLPGPSSQEPEERYTVRQTLEALGYKYNISMERVHRASTKASYFTGFILKIKDKIPKLSQTFSKIFTTFSRANI